MNHSPADTISWGMIGAGAVCEVKSGPAFYRSEHSRLFGVMRRNADKAQDYAKRHAVPNWYTDAETLIHHPEVNAVYIATPPDTHASYTEMAARAGKAVYVEKPMARTYSECEQMIRVCHECGVPLFVAYYRRYLPYFRKVKELLDDGAIGRVLSVHIQLTKGTGDTDPATNWRIDPQISGGGLFHDLASHQLDLLDFLLGPVTSARGETANRSLKYNAPDAVSASFSFASGVTGSGNWTFSAPPHSKSDRLIFVGTLGTIQCATFDDSTPVRLITETGIQEFVIPYPPHVQQPLVEAIIRDLRGGEPCISTGESAARASMVMDQIAGTYDSENAVHSG